MKKRSMLAAACAACGITFTLLPLPASAVNPGPFSFHDSHYYFDQEGDVALEWTPESLGNLASASICIEGEGRPSDPCSNALTPGSRELHVRPGWHVTVFTRDRGSSSGGEAGRPATGSFQTSVASFVQNDYRLGVRAHWR